MNRPVQITALEYRVEHEEEWRPVPASGLVSGLPANTVVHIREVPLALSAGAVLVAGEGENVLQDMRDGLEGRLHPPEVFKVVRVMAKRFEDEVVIPRKRKRAWESPFGPERRR